MPAPLLKTKFYLPQLTPNQVSRSRLVERLNDGVAMGRKFTLISAPAGFGKTTLLASWLHEHTCKTLHIAWLTLDEADTQDVIRFWLYVLNALQIALPGTGDIAMAMLSASSPPEMDTVLTSIINEIAAQSATVLLVLDDYQYIQAQSIHDAISFLLEHAPPQLHLAIATRVDPPLNIARLRVRGQITELRAGDLRFTLQEATTFLNEVMRIGLSPADVAALEKRTEGWIAGLLVAAMAMRNREDTTSFIDAFTGSHRHILHYLIEEVFAQQPEQIKSFLLQTSVLDRLCGPLCDALTGQDDGQAMLERLEMDNLFVVALDDEQQWYRYHQLFQDVLRAHRQRTALPETTSELHRRASIWYEHQGEIHQAVQHALQIGDSERIASLLSKPATKMIGEYGLDTLRCWLDELPDTMVRTKVNLSMSYAWIYLANSQPEKVENYLQDVERMLGVTASGAPSNFSPTPAVRCKLAEVLGIRANVAFHYSDLAGVLTFSQEAAHYLDDEVKATFPHEWAELQGVVTFTTGLAYEFGGRLGQATEQFQISLHLNHQEGNWHLIPVVTSHLAQVLKAQGKIKQAAETYQRAIQYTEEVTAPPSPLSGIAHTGLGDIWYELNELIAAEACLQRGIALAEPWTYWETLTSGVLYLSRVKAAQGDWEQADALLLDLWARLPVSLTSLRHGILSAQRAWLWMRQGNPDGVRTWLQQTDLHADSDLVYLRETELLILARGLITVGETQPSVHLLQRLCNAMEQGERTGSLIEGLALLALAQHALKQPQVALSTLQRAVALAAPGGYIRLFVDMGQPMQLLLTQIKYSDTELTTYINTLLLAFPTINHRGSGDSKFLPEAQPLVEPLSDRELELLSLIATGMTNHAISQELVVSINTVKTHARNIYGKLNVRNRTEAVAKARELGII